MRCVRGKDSHMWSPDDNLVELVLFILHVSWGSNTSQKVRSASEFTHLAISLTPEVFFLLFFVIKAINIEFVICNS